MPKYISNLTNELAQLRRLAAEIEQNCRKNTPPNQKTRPLARISAKLYMSSVETRVLQFSIEYDNYRNNKEDSAAYPRIDLNQLVADFTKELRDISVYFTEYQEGLKKINRNADRIDSYHEEYNSSESFNANSMMRVNDEPSGCNFFAFWKPMTNLVSKCCQPVADDSIDLVERNNP
jgi:hypothetical protein